MTAAVRTAKAGLIVHAFGALEEGLPSVESAATQAFMPRLAEACRTLGMREPALAEHPVDLAEPTASARGADFEIVSAARRASDEETYETYTFTFHDVLGCTVALASNRPEDGIETWRARLDEWERAIGDATAPDAFLGQSFVFFALGNPLNHSLEQEVQDALTPMGIEALAEASFRTTDGLRLWQGADAAGRRVVVAVAASTHEAELDRFVWWQGETHLAALTRYLLHEVKLSYEEKVFLLRRESLHERGADVDVMLKDLLERYGQPWSKGARAGADVVNAQRTLNVAQADDTGLIWQTSRMRELHRTVEIADGNLRGLARSFGFDDEENPASDPTMFGRDLRRSTWLMDQIDHEIWYADAITERATEVYNLTTLRLQSASEEVERSRARIDLFQTVLLGALFSGLFVADALGVTYPVVPDQVRMPALVFAVAALVALPLLTVHWHERYGLTDWIAAGVMGATLAWLLTVLAWPQHTASWPVVLPIAVAGGALSVWILSRLHDRGRRVT